MQPRGARRDVRNGAGETAEAAVEALLSADAEAQVVD
jgi:hypothetical protein